MTSVKPSKPTSHQTRQPIGKSSERTQQAIREAGSQLFARHGYSHTSVREVARLAGVNVALINRYFGSKEGLFRTVLDEAFSLEEMLDIPLDQFGKEVARLFFLPGSNLAPLAMTALSVADPVAHDIVSDIVHKRVILPLAAHLGEPDGVSRASRLVMLWSGLSLGLRLMPNIMSSSLKKNQHWLSEEIQRIVSEGAE